MSTPGHYPQALEELIVSLRRLPGIGSRTAERLALAMLDWPAPELEQFGEQLATLKKRLRFCDNCGNLAEGPLCRICADPRRQTDVICVVEHPGQIPVFERAGCFRGLYHVLGGRIEPLDGKGPGELHIEPLRHRLQTGQVRELILATSSDIEGEATAAYLADTFRDLPVAITRLAAGLPIGADLGFADSATISVALSARRVMSRP